MFKLFVVLGSINAFLAVILGAFGAHGLRDRLSPDMLDIYQTGVQYHMYHALGLILIGFLAQWLAPSMLLNWSGWLLLIGIFIFSGSLYLLSTTGTTWLGAITPLGGLSFLLGWILVILAVIRSV